MKKLYYLLILLIPVAIIMLSITLVETISQIIDINPDRITISRPDENVNRANINSYLKLSAEVLPEKAVDKTVFWHSSNNDIATIDENGNVYFKTIEITYDNNNKVINQPQVTFTAKTVNGVVDHVTYYIEDKIVRGVSITSDIEWIDLNTSHTLEYSVLPTIGANIKNTTWSSSNENAISVDDAGKITAKQPGYATIALTIDGFTDTINIRAVKAAQAINVVNNFTITEKHEIDLLNFVTVAPLDSTREFDFYIYSGQNIAALNNNLLTFSNQGEVVVSISPKYRTKNNLSTLLTIESTMGKIKSINLSNLPTLNISEPNGVKTINLLNHLTFVPTDYSGTFEISSTNQNVLKQQTDNNNILNAIAGGVSVVTVSQNGVSVSRNITVTEYVNQISFGHVADETGVIESFVNPFSNPATSYPITANNRDIVFSSSNTAVATVSSSGVVEFLQNDIEVTITATARDNGKYSNSYKIISRAIEKIISDLKIDVKNEVGGEAPEPIEYNGTTLLTNSSHEFEVNYKSDANIVKQQVTWTFSSTDIPNSAFIVENNIARVNLVQNLPFARTASVSYYSGYATIGFTLTITDIYDQEYSFTSSTTYYFSNNKTLSFDIEFEKDKNMQEKNYIYYTGNSQETDIILVSVLNVFPKKNNFDIEYSDSKDILFFNPTTKTLSIKRFSPDALKTTATFKIDNVVVEKEVNIIVVSNNITFTVDKIGSNNVYHYATVNSFVFEVNVLPANTTNPTYNYKIKAFNANGVEDNTVAYISNETNTLMFNKKGKAIVTVYATDRNSYGFNSLEATKTFIFDDFETTISKQPNEMPTLTVGDSFEINLQYEQSDMANYIGDYLTLTFEGSSIIEYQLITSQRIKITAINAGSGTLVLTYSHKNKTPYVLKMQVTTQSDTIQFEDVFFTNNNQQVEDNQPHQKIVVGNKQVASGKIVDYTSHSFDFKILNLNDNFEFKSSEILVSSNFVLNQSVTGSLVKNTGNDKYTYIGKIAFTIPTLSLNEQNASIVFTNSQQQIVATQNFYIVKDAINVNNYAEFDVANKTANKTIVLFNEIQTVSSNYKLYTNIFGNGNIMHGTTVFATQTSSQIFAVSKANLTFNNVHFMGSKQFGGEFVKGTRRLLSVGQTNTKFVNSIISNHQDLIFSENANGVTFESVIFRNSSNKGLRLISSSGKASNVTVKNSSFVNMGSMAIDLKNTNNDGLGINLTLVGDVGFYNYLPDNQVLPLVKDALAEWPVSVTAPDKQMEIYDLYKPQFYEDDVVLTSRQTPETKYMALGIYIYKNLNVFDFDMASHYQNINVNTDNLNNNDTIVKKEITINLYIESIDTNAIIDLIVYQIKNTNPALSNLNPFTPAVPTPVWVNI